MVTYKYIENVKYFHCYNDPNKRRCQIYIDSNETLWNRQQKSYAKYGGQIKRVSRNISNSEILQLRGTLLGGEEGIFVITSHFTPSAIEDLLFPIRKKFI